MAEYTIIDCSCSFDSIWQYTNESNIDIKWAFRGSNSKIISFVRMMWYKWNLPMKSLWINKSLSNLKGTSIIFDVCATIPFLKWFQKNNPDTRCIFYFWNSIAHTKLDIEEIRNAGFEIWGFDKKDSEAYHYQYNPQFFCPSWYDSIRNVNPAPYDISFVGRDCNGKMQNVEQIIDILNSNKPITSNIYFVAPKWYLFFKNKKYKKMLSFKEVLQEEMKATALLDIVKNGQNGYSLRVFDALCNEKKLITNNLNIIEEEFYDSNNVFVYGHDSLDKLSSFLSSPFEHGKADKVKSLSIEHWLMNFSQVEC